MFERRNVRSGSLVVVLVGGAIIALWLGRSAMDGAVANTGASVSEADSETKGLAKAPSAAVSVPEWVAASARARIWHPPHERTEDELSRYPGPSPNLPGGRGGRSDGSGPMPPEVLARRRLWMNSDAGGWSVAGIGRAESISNHVENFAPKEGGSSLP
jgi:hypothetical protein